MKIAYSGIEGAFAHIAAKRIFPAEELISYGDFRSAYEAVEKGECDYAVLPIENSYAGEVGQVTDLMFQGGLFVNGVLYTERYAESAWRKGSKCGKCPQGYKSSTGTGTERGFYYGSRI